MASGPSQLMVVGERVSGTSPVPDREQYRASQGETLQSFLERLSLQSHLGLFQVQMKIVTRLWISGLFFTACPICGLRNGIREGEVSFFLNWSSLFSVSQSKKYRPNKIS